MTVRGRRGRWVIVERPAHVSGEHVLRPPASVQDGGDFGSTAAEHVWHLEARRVGWQARRDRGAEDALAPGFEAVCQPALELQLRIVEFAQADLGDVCVDVRLN